MNNTQQHIVNASAHELPLPGGLFHCSATSPPYYSLRQYSGEQTIVWPDVRYSPLPGLPPITVVAMSAPLGLEPTVEAYIGHIVLVYREVWRVSRSDSVHWLNLGDSNEQDGNRMFIPHRIALALQADGWTVRNDCVWKKANPMPESVAGWRWERCRVKVGTDKGAGKQPTNQGSLTAQSGCVDVAHWQPCPGCPKCENTGGYVLRRGSWRHTRSHEFVFMLSKGMGYYSDGEKVREPLTESSMQRMDQSTFHSQKGGPKDYGSGSNRSCRKALENLEKSRNGRNPRTVLSPGGSAGYKKCHYAVYPPKLIAPLIRAGCPTRCCPSCGAAWAPVVEREFIPQQGTSPQALIRGAGNQKAMSDDGSNDWDGFPRGTTQTAILAHRPTCACPDHEPVAGWVLDPFVGSGTTLAVCREWGVNAVGVDLSPGYLDEHVKVRLGRTPSNALEGLPLFEDI